ncbi:hypothetical protein [Streptomyces sp. NBC_00401]|uniref:hypothetical protein n=1 Tax=unclassified Streptomyces TaxID=2593676 RepID=UPI002256DF44|nr:hypothetical protein [Streptomyces sp. NBC_00401]MCX5085415.1 hypothetical protein [Streptomyces sp. NBC_00401]
MDEAAKAVAPDDTRRAIGSGWFRRAGTIGTSLSECAAMWPDRKVWTKALNDTGFFAIRR